MRTVRHLLIVEDFSALADTLRASMLGRAERVSVTPSLAEARRVLAEDPPDAVILDYALPDGDGDTLLPELRAVEPLPHVIAISGSANPEQAFRLAQAGVRAFLSKPLDLARLDEVWAETLSRPPDLIAPLRASVGGAPLHSIEEQVRHTMVGEALAQSGGSVRGAAKLLGISRQLLQQILRKRA